MKKLMENLACVLEIYVISLKGVVPARVFPTMFCPKHCCGLLNSQHNTVAYPTRFIKYSRCSVLWLWNTIIGTKKTINVGNKNSNVMFVCLRRQPLNDLAVKNVAIRSAYHISHYFSPVDRTHTKACLTSALTSAAQSCLYGPGKQ